MSVTWGSIGGAGLNLKHLGYGLLLGGAALQIAETMAKTSGTTGNLAFDQTAMGKVVAPLEKILPLSLGWSLIAAGVIIIWVVPKLGAFE